MPHTKQEKAWLAKQQLCYKAHAVLLKNIKAHMPELTAIYERQVEREFKDGDLHPAEDIVYRFYHHSFKVYRAQQVTSDILVLLNKMAPEGTKLCSWFMEIVADGIGHHWNHAHNRHWTKHTRPILEAYFHAIYFLKAAVRYGQTLESAPNMLPSGWAALLELYGIR